MGKKKDEYRQWILENENATEAAAMEERKKGGQYQPLFSVLLFAEGVSGKHVKECKMSIERQSYGSWELIEVTKENALDIWAQAHGEYVMFVWAKNLLAVNAFKEMADMLNEGVAGGSGAYDFIYSDEDTVSRNGRKRYAPFFKPDWSPDLFWCMRYTGQLAVYQRNLAKQAVEGMQDKEVSLWEAWQYEFLLRFLELTNHRRIGHVSKVLYHKRDVRQAGGRMEEEEQIGGLWEGQQYIPRVKEEALKRRGLKGVLEAVPDMKQYRVVYECPRQPLVSIIIPSKDNVPMLKQCLSSIRSQTQYKNYEIIVVDNGSTAKNREILNTYADLYGIHYHYEKLEFNFSHMCNLGAGKAEGDYLLFLNDDIEITQKDWLERLLGQAMQHHCGAVGAKLLYPHTQRIQHVGIANLKMSPSHYLREQPDDIIYYYGRNRLEYNCLAVTGACLMVDRQKYREVGGFEESLAVTFNDVDLCFKLYEAGYYNVVRNDVCLYHHESVSRGLDTFDEGKMLRMIQERENLLKRHPQIGKGDPFYSVHLTQDKTDFRLHVNGDSLKESRCMGILERPERYGAEFALHIDAVVPDTEISVRGWYYWKNEAWMRRSKAYVVLKDRQGKCSYYETCPQDREDVAKALKLKTAECGFTCRIPREDLERGDARFQIGLLLSVPWLGLKRLKWCEESLKL